MPKLTALVPAHNDDYTLCLCLRSIVAYFDHVIVLDDASTDNTAEVALDFARRHLHVRYLRHEGRQLGWIEARNRLLASTESDHLFWLDADDVLCERNARSLRRIAAGHEAIVRLQLCELWGDLQHTTQRLRHYDRCHVFTNRRKLRDLRWGGHSAAAVRANPGGARKGAFHSARSEGPLLFHIKGVKPDRRLVERRFMRPWYRAGRPTRTVAEFAHMDRMDKPEIHRRALDVLLNSRQDKIQRPAPADALQLPAVLRQGPGTRRFKMAYRDGRPVDRRDHGWQPPRG